MPTHRPTQSMLLAVLAYPLAAGAQTAVVDGVHYRWDIPEFPPDAWENPPSQSAAPYPTDAWDDCVPLGVVHGDFGHLSHTFVFERIRKMGGNAYFISGSHHNEISAATDLGIEILARTAARMGIRVYFQNQSSSLHWPTRINNPPLPPREGLYNQVSSWATGMLPQFHTDPELRWGLHIWGITEEIDSGTASDIWLKRLRDDMAALDPSHPPVILLRTTDAAVQETMVQTWGVENVALIITDHYNSGRGVPLSQVPSLNLNRLTIWSNLANQYNKKVWLMTSISSHLEDLDPASTAGHRMVTPDEAGMALWTGLAYGFTGFYIWHGYDNDAAGISALTRFDWKPTESYARAGRIFHRFKRLSPLIAKWSHQGTSTPSNVAVGQFTHPDFQGIFIVIANVRPDQPSTYVPASALVELEGFRTVTDPVTLRGGAGMVLFEGSGAEIDTLKQLLGDGMYPLRKKTLGPSVVQRWHKDTGAGGIVEQNVAVYPVTFGGKGALPVMPRSNFPFWGGDLLDWGDGVKVPSVVYYAPYPGPDTDTALFLQWPSNELAGLDIDRAILNLDLDNTLPGGRLAVYPVVTSGHGFEGITEYGPRYELRTNQVGPAGLRFHITGIAREWAEGEMPNLGLLLVYEGFPSINTDVIIGSAPSLEIEHQAAVNITAVRVVTEE